MKMKETMQNAVLAMCMMVTCLFATSCDKDKDSEGRPHYTKYVDINITRCERVGSVLMIDFTVKNKQETMLTVTLRDQNVIDDAGNTYVSMWADKIAHVQLGSSDYSDGATANIPGNREATGHIKVYDFDPLNKSTEVDLIMAVGIDGVELSNKKYDESGIVIVDNRVLDNGIQSNDTKLSYQVTSCIYNQEDNNVYLDFTITNNTGTTLKEFGMGYMHGGEARVYDNNTNTYESQIRFGEDEWYHFGATDLFMAGATQKATIKIENVRSTATELTIYIGASAKDYLFEDGTVRFLAIPIQR